MIVIGMNETPKAAPTCRWCGYELCIDRVICQKCDRHQGQYFERSKQLVTVAAAVGVLGSATAYIAPSVKDYLVSFTDPSLRVVSLRTETQDSLVLNAGQRPILVSHFQAVALDGTTNEINFTSTLNAIMEPGEALKPDLRSLASIRIDRSNELSNFEIQGSGTKEDLAAVLKLLGSAPDNVRRSVKLQIMSDDEPLAKSILEQPENPSDPAVGPMVIDFECCFVFSALGDFEETSIEIPCTGFISTSYDSDEFWEVVEEYR
jgi:hypothetical protein